MSRFWKCVHDGCFYGQVLVAVGINLLQGWHMLGSLQGVLLTYYLCMEAFMLFNLLLALEVDREKRNTESRMAVRLYLIFLAMVSIGIGAIAWNGTYEWARQDTVTTCIVAGGVALIAMIKGSRGWSWNGPEIRTLLGILVKAVPQVLLAWRIWADGGAGIHEAVLWLGHSSSIMRLTQMLIMNVSTGWTRSGVGLLISESANEASWIVVTAAWYGRT